MNGKRPILIIEDSDDDFDLLRRLLTSAGVTVPVERMTGGSRAIEHCSRAALETAPSLVFTDLSMPDGDGFEFLAWARLQPMLADTLLVVLSATRRGADIDRAYSLGAHFFMSKFPTPTVLAGLCAAAQKRELALQARIAPFRRETALSV